MGIASQLELLRGAHQNDVGFSSDDDVEAPDFDEERYLDSPSRAVSHSIGLGRDGSTFEIDEQHPSDEGSKLFVRSVIAGCTVSETLDLHAKGKQKQYNPCTWSAADEDVKRPVDDYSAMGGRPTMRAESSSPCKGRKNQAFLSSIQKCEDRYSSSDDDLQDEPETVDYWPVDESVSEHLGCSGVRQISESNLRSLVESDIQHDCSRHSMVELLDELRGKRRNAHFKCKMGRRRKGKMGQHTVIRSVSSSGKDIMSDEEPCEVMDSGSSTDNENPKGGQWLTNFRKHLVLLWMIGDLPLQY
uniref:Uncharacterized protein n=1 Tax=Opuntia streptacantha TaxID=393608 RepID=A0A7C9DKM8_OPUST